MSRKKLITYLLIALTLIMIVDLKYINSEKHLFDGFITDSIREVIDQEGGTFKNKNNTDDFMEEKEMERGSGKDFLAGNQNELKYQGNSAEYGLKINNE